MVAPGRPGVLETRFSLELRQQRPSWQFVVRARRATNCSRSPKARRPENSADKRRLVGRLRVTPYKIAAARRELAVAWFSRPRLS